MIWLRIFTSFLRLFIHLFPHCPLATLRLVPTVTLCHCITQGLHLPNHRGHRVTVGTIVRHTYFDRFLHADLYFGENILEHTGQGNHALW